MATIKLLALILMFYVAVAAAEEASTHDELLGGFSRMVKKGSRCHPVWNNVCPGIAAKDGTEFLQCCKRHCRNVLSDRNNCGVCGRRCRFGELCCRSRCTAVAYDADNCGRCGEKCSSGLRCEYGVCGYA